MKIDLDAERIPVSCPYCGMQHFERIGILRHAPGLVCVACLETFRMQPGQLDFILESAHRSMDDLSMRLGSPLGTRSR
ncbi:hypothetical protein [Nitrosovibrio sp. Nv17]|uniref:hypothetical protein n=1 Tax=Nitrosovibrio sp. Nv17 TaxID=1855339 RepID=UPI000908F498|nr:hypothetical protein [Nitrosovibrio sp. Nv17]SFW14090.1 hypothetical protein SAMN05216414_102118 [Nitrosovibrio sp. Nv17]